MTPHWTRRRPLATIVFAAAWLASADARQPPQATQTPRFLSSVEVTSLDVAVVDDHGKPMTNLAPGDFTVRIDGNPRRVVTAEWVPLVTPAGDNRTTATTSLPDGYSSNESSTGGRLIVIAVDEPNIRFGGALAISKAANAFVDRLSPADRVAVAGFGPGAPATVFTADRARVKQAISRMVGRKQASGRSADFGHDISVTEALAIERGDRMTLQAVVTRECQSMGTVPGSLDSCSTEVEVAARTKASDRIHASDETLQALRDLFQGLRAIDAPKTLILISEGFILTDESLVMDLGALAASARTSLYAMRLDSQSFDIANSGRPIDPMGDRFAQGQGLETLAGASRGTLFTVTGSGSTLFERIESELSGYYLLGVESDPRDRDGKPHPVRVDVPRRGALVRSRRQLVTLVADQSVTRPPHQVVAAALGSPLLASALPLRVASFALQGPERDKVQLLIHADIGSDYPASRAVSLGYVISDKDGRLVDSKAVDARLPPVMNGVPSPLQYTMGASLSPGTYTLKLAVAEGNRVGTVEHPIHAVLPDPAGDVVLSELMLGGPTEVAELLRPTIGYEVTFGSVHGYIEAYGPKLDSVTMEYEIAKDAEGPALINVDVPPRPAGDARVIFSHVMPVRALPPGKYMLRAILSAGGRSIKTLARPFEVAPPKVLLTSAEGIGATSVESGLFLPVEDAALVPAFRREQVIDPAAVEPFRERVGSSAQSDFDRGVSLLAAGDYPKAEASFKLAISPDGDSTAPLTYLAASFAAAGHDNEAASAWQTALVDGDEFPQIYQWLADALLRTHDLAQARTILEEAIGKWPADVRFAKPLAMVYATFGRGREAVRTLERYLSARHDDRDAYYMAVQWLYTVHSSGVSVHGRSEDVKLAHTYADAYAKASGPQAALVKQWVDFLDAQQ
jgi:VWFA-related protein